MIDLIIPIFNGEQIVKLLKRIKSDTVLKNVFLCYDNDFDNVFDIKKIFLSSMVSICK